MNALIVGGTRDIKHAVEILKKYDINTYVVDGNPQAEGFAFVDNYDVVDISDEQAVKEYAISKDIDFIMPVPIGRFVTTWGYVNDSLGYKGISKKGADNATDKWLFHQLLNQNGLRDVKAYLIDENFKKEEINPEEFPFIIKPRFGAGSKGVKYLANKEEFLAYVEDVNDFQDYILEQAFPGIEFGVDVMIIDKKAKIILLREKKNTPLPNRQAIAYYSSFSDEIDAGLQEKFAIMLQKAIDVLEIDNALMHVDLMVNGEDLFIIELSPRPSGHNLHNNFTIKATEIDMLDEFIKFQLENKNFDSLIPKDNVVAMHYFDFENCVFEYVPSFEEVNKIDGVIEYTCSLKPGDIRKTISQGADLINDGFVVVEGKDKKDLDQKVEQVKDLFKVRSY